MLDTPPLPPCMGVPSHMFTPHSFIGFPVHQYVLAISACDMGNISLMLQVGGVPHLLGVWGASAHGLSICFLVHSSCMFLLFIMLHFSTTGMTATPPVMVVSSGISSVSSVTVAPSLMGLPATFGQCEVVQPPPLMLRGSGGVLALPVCHSSNLPSLMPLLVHANYAMGSPHVGFFFRVEPPTILYIICWCPFWCLLSLSGAKLDAVITYGGSTIRVCTFATLWSLPMSGIYQAR